MTAAYKDYILERGSTFSKVYTMRDAANALVNFTGATAKMQAKIKKNTTAFVLSTSNSTISVVLGGAAGTITVTITDENTAALTQTEGEELFYDLEVNWADGSKSRILEGKFIISDNVTDI